MSASAPKKKITRIKEKPVEFVKFNLDAFEGDFVVPKFPPPLGLLKEVQRGLFVHLSEWLEEKGTDPETIEALDQIEGQEEIQEFIGAWSSGEVATAPKSSK